MIPRENVYKAVDGEREYQDEKWLDKLTGVTDQHTTAEFVLYMIDYIEEARQQLSRNPESLARLLALATVRKITTLGVACMEQNGAPQREGFER